MSLTEIAGQGETPLELRQKGYLSLLLGRSLMNQKRYAEAIGPLEQSFNTWEKYFTLSEPLPGDEGARKRAQTVLKNARSLSGQNDANPRSPDLK
jgi:hypothetical protein